MFPGGGLQKQPQMVSPHAASLQQPVTYTRASYEILEGRGGRADENAHSRCSSALTSAPAALLRQPGAAGSAKSFPSLLPSQPLRRAPSHAVACQRGVSGQGTMSQGGERASHALHGVGRLLDAPCRSRSGLQLSFGGISHPLAGPPKGWRGAAIPPGSASPIHGALLQGCSLAVLQKGLQNTSTDGSRTPKPLSSSS